MRLSKRNVLINVLLALFVFISFYLYGVFDTVTDEKRTELLRHQSELRKLKSQVHSLEKKLRGNAEAMRTIREELANSEQQRKNQEIQKDNAIALAIENADNVLEGKLNAEMQDEDSRDAGEGAAQLPIPRNKVAIVHDALTGLSRREQCLAMLNYSSAKTDVQMLDMYKIIPFDNIDGGVWKQGWELKYDANEVKKEKPLEVFVIPHSHCDPGWIMTFEDYYQQRTKNILNGMVRHLSEKPGMKFIYAEMSFFEMWWAEQSEGTRQKVREHLKSGQLEIVTGGWVMTDEANAHYHSIITELFEGHEFLQNNIGKEFLPKSHWSIDPFGLSPSLPLLLSEANITDAVLQRVHYSVKKKLSETKQLEFMWRQLWGGSDARHDVRSHLFPFYSYDVPHTCGPEPKVCCQFDFKRLPGGGVTCDWGVPPQSINSKNVEQRAFMIYDQYRKKSQLFKTNVLLIPLGDDFRYQDDFEWNNQHDNYKQLFDYMNAKTEWNVKARFGTLADYFDALDASLKEDQQQLPVLSGDFFTYADRDDHYWSGYFTSRPFYKHMDRILQHYLRTAEIAYSLAQIDGGNLDDGVLPKLVEVRRALSLFQHHDGVTGTAKDAVVNDYGEKMLSALKRAEEVTTTSIASLLDKSTQISMSFDEFRAKQDSLPEARIFEADSSLLLFNTLAHSRAEVACIQVASPNIRIKRSDGTTPEQQLAPVLVHRDGRIQAQMGRFELCFWAEIGALASEVFTLYSKDEQSAAELVLVKGSAKPASLDHFFKFEQSSGSVELANTLVTAVFSGVTGFLKEIRLASGEKMDVNAHFVKYGARPHGSLRNGGGDNLSGAYVFLPDGQARPMEVTQPSFVVTEGPLMKRILATGPNDGKLNQLYSLEKESYSIGIRNTIDLSNRPDNIEVALRFETNIANGEDLFTDLNDLQVIRRRRMLDKLPIQAHFYPMPGSAYIEDTKQRLTLLGAQALGVASLKTGQIEVMLDRRTQQDDNRGLFQPLADNRLTVSHFRLIIEPLTAISQQIDDSPMGHLTPIAHHTSLSLLYPWVKIMGKGIPTSKKMQGLTASLPCDVHLVTLRTMTGPTDYNNNRAVKPKNEAALVLRRWVSECRSARKLLDKKCSDATKINVRDLFVGSIKSVHEASLTMLYVDPAPGGIIEVEPHRVKTVKIVY